MKNSAIVISWASEGHDDRSLKVWINFQNPNTALEAKLCQLSLTYIRF